MKYKWQIIAGVSVLVIVLGVIVGFGLSGMFQEPVSKPPKKTVKKAKPKPEPQSSLCAFKGDEIQKDVTRPLAIMVENLSTIRPQAGLNDACIVVEALAEGGITRLMLVFGAHGSDNVGPIRSARTHYVALADGWDAIYSHVGGSIYATRAIKDWGVNDWDQSFHAGSYDRVRWTSAPHNVFTSTSRIREAAKEYKEGGDIQSVGFKFKKTPPMKSRPEGQKKVTIDFSDPQYLVDYQYDRQSNTYKRFNGGSPHEDANTKTQVAPTNIIVMRAQTRSIAGGSGVLDIDVTGTGNLTVFRDGKVIDGSWEKSSPGSPLKLKDSSGKVIPLSPGQTWIEIVRPTTQVTIQ
ncbi:MAG TPA: DUF3048 domain-containing protein [Actinobacteria bacterium]|nr:DUF3048 domain-containing protein [Actinomycetota bacterium]